MRSFHAAALIAGVALAGAACHRMATLTLDEVERLRPSSIWVTHADNPAALTEIGGPQVFHDTIVGYVNGEFTELPVADLRKMMVRQPARAKTIALFAAGTIGVGGLVWLVSGIGKSDNPGFYADCEDDPLLPECQNR